jgi:hypothetical protein
MLFKLFIISSVFAVLGIRDILVPTDPDPDLRIHTSDKRIRIPIWIRIQIRIRILLFSSLTFKMATKNYFFTRFFCSLGYYLKVHLHHLSKINNHKKSQNRRNEGFSYCFCLIIEGSGSGWPKNIRIRIPNTGFLAV